ncbi:MAG: Cupin domain protein [Firmicutes bacterium ADurb.Bin182]|nr:MAG: Cupin domain protein [Firmicutes bacterium ADurb.Bin182]
MKLFKNIEKSKALKLSDLVQYQEGQIVSKTLVQNASVSITLFAFDKAEEISSHASHGDAMLTVLDGKAGITVGESKSVLSAGETIVMPADIPHAVYAEEQMKFLLTVVF